MQALTGNNKMSESLWYSKTKLITLAAVLILGGCGGSGGGNKTPPPPTNVAPTANAGPAQSVARMEAVTLDGSASSDSDGTISTYAWTQTGGTAVTLDSAVPDMPTFTSPDTPAGEDLTFSLVVTDDDTDSPNSTFHLFLEVNVVHRFTCFYFTSFFVGE